METLRTTGATLSGCAVVPSAWAVTGAAAMQAQSTAIPITSSHRTEPGDSRRTTENEFIRGETESNPLAPMCGGTTSGSGQSRTGAGNATGDVVTQRERLSCRWLRRTRVKMDLSRRARRRCTGRHKKNAPIETGAFVYLVRLSFATRGNDHPPASRASPELEASSF